MGNYSVNRRVLFATTVAAISFLGIAGWVLDIAFRQSAAESEHLHLETAFYGLLAVADVSADKKLTIPNFLADERFNRPQSGLYATITDTQNKPLWTSRSRLGINLPETNDLETGERRFLISSDNDSFFIYSAGIEWEVGPQQSISYTFHIFSSPENYQAQVNQFRKSLWGWFAAITIGLLVVQFILLRWSLSSLRLLEHNIKEMEAGNSSQLSGDYPVELKTLTHNLNHLIKTREQQLERYRNSLDDLAHSLKTPLAVLKGMDDDKNKAMVDEQTQRMTSIINYHLQRAATAAVGAPFTKTALKPAIERLAKSMQRIYPGLNISIDIENDTKISLEENDLMELMGNLLDNACKWAKADISVSASVTDVIQIIVEDDGPGIDPQQIEQVLQRGFRADENIDGQGIGLAIARDITQAHGGKLELSNNDDHGALVKLTFPA